MTTEKILCVDDDINILAGFLLMMLLMGTLMTVFLNYYTAQLTAFL